MCWGDADAVQSLRRRLASPTVRIGGEPAAVLISSDSRDAGPCRILVYLPPTVTWGAKGPPLSGRRGLGTRTRFSCAAEAGAALRLNKHEGGTRMSPRARNRPSRPHGDRGGCPAAGGLGVDAGGPDDAGLPREEAESMGQSAEVPGDRER